MTQQLFELAQLESGQMAPQLRSIQVNKLLNEIYAAFQLDIGASNQIFKLTLPDRTDYPTVRLDLELIRRVFTNLLHNAIKYTLPGHTIEIGCEVLPAQVIFKVADTGTGIPPHDLPHIFERFYMGAKARSNSAGSSGLGLAIVKEIIELHQGQIWAESNFGKGTAIYFALPAIAGKV